MDCVLASVPDRVRVRVNPNPRIYTEARFRCCIALVEMQTATVYVKVQ